MENERQKQRRAEKYQQNKENIKKKQLEYRKVNREKLRLKRREYVKANKDKVKEADRIYRQKNREVIKQRDKDRRVPKTREIECAACNIIVVCVSEYRKYCDLCRGERQREEDIRRIERDAERVKRQSPEYAEEQREKRNTYARDRYKENPQKNKDKVSDWQKRNPEKYLMKKWRQKARKYNNGPIENVCPSTVYKAGKGICALCNKKIDIDIKYPHPMSFTMDHIIPSSKGGTHTYANIQPAHARCNISKGARTIDGGEQLCLV